jgi:hypothetical protein
MFFKEPTMISRLTFSAAVFAIVSAATLTFAAESHQQQHVATARSAAAAPAPVVVMPVVEITGRRPH